MIPKLVTLVKLKPKTRPDLKCLPLEVLAKWGAQGLGGFLILLSAFGLDDFVD